MGLISPLLYMVSYIVQSGVAQKPKEKKIKFLVDLFSKDKAIKLSIFKILHLLHVTQKRKKKVNETCSHLSL